LAVKMQVRERSAAGRSNRVHRSRKKVWTTCYLGTPYHSPVGG
jgi:hypothetical protein